MPFVCFHNSIALYPHRRLFAATATVLPYLLGVGTRQLLHHSPLFREEETPAIKRTEVVCRRLYHHRKHNCYRNPLKETVVSPWSWCDKARRSTQQLPDPFFRSRSHLTSRSVAVMAASSSSTTATQAPPTAISTFGSLFENDLKTDKLCGDAGVAAGKRYQHNGYEYLLLDQWGVMHDGSTALAGAAECVARPRIGFDPSHFVGAVTSGEATFQYIAQNGESLRRTRGTEKRGQEKKRPLRVFWIAWKQKPGEANDFLAELPFDVECVSPSEVASADFLLLQGCDVLGNGSGQEKLMSFHDNGDLKRPENVPLKTALDAAATARLPLLCANPDRKIVRPDGKGFFYQPGLLAAIYEETLQQLERGKERTEGGNGPNGQGTTDRENLVLMFGKPEPPVYDACLRLFTKAETEEARARGATSPQPGVPIDKRRVLAVGDSLSHDVLGASRAGIDSVFVWANGVHRDALLDGNRGEEIDSDEAREARIKQLLKEYGVDPTFTLPSFTW